MVVLPTHCIAHHLLLHFWLHGSAVVQSHCTVWHLLSACPGLPLSCQPTLPDAVKDTATLRHLRHQDSISVTEIVRMLARALRLNYQRSSFPFVPLITIRIVPATSSCLPQPCP